MTIKEICAAYSLTQKALSDRFEIPLRTVESWAGEKRTPPPYVVNMIVEILDKEKSGQ